jgi:hypothetical protein
MSLSIKDTINIRVVNNTALPQTVNMLGGTSDPLSVPPYLLYVYDLSTENYTGTNVILIITTVQAPFTNITYTAPLNGNNIQALVTILNGFNVGTFQVTGNTIYVSNDFYIYGKIEIS